MNEDYERQLEAEIDRALKGLRELPAPHSLISNVMAEIENRAHLPWYRQSWTMWPAPVRAISFMALLSLFSGICFGSWELVHGQNFAVAMRQVGGWFSGLSAVWNTINVLLGAAVVVVKNLSTGFMIGCVAALALGYAMCVGLGTVYVRLGLVRR
jgi:hypothetical protein